MVFLHGRGQNENTFLNDEFFSALEDLGDRAPIVAFPYGDDHSYFHNRADGAWGDYITGEVIPEVVEQFGADGDRVAIGGVSMGGFGAYDLARLNPGRSAGGRALPRALGRPRATRRQAPSTMPPTSRPTT